MSLIEIFTFITGTAKNVSVNELLKKTPLFITIKSISATGHINKKYVFIPKSNSGITMTNLSYQFAILMSCGRSKEFLKYRI